jgi:ADP-ribose pyrophosphatase YjhB (NUDIX family)
VALPLRDAVRAVVLDGEDRLLLVRFGLGDRPFWATPGGGVEAGESHDAAIRRELHEEVGLIDVAVGPALWTRTHVFALSPQFGGQRETFYLVRVEGAGDAPAFSREELRAEGVTGSRWWTSEALREARHERFVPQRLVELYHALVHDGPPGAVVDAGL